MKNLPIDEVSFCMKESEKDMSLRRFLCPTQAKPAWPSRAQDRNFGSY